MIQLDQVSKIYGAQHAVDALSFQVGKGEIVGFLGPNGAGKTTLIRCLADGAERSSGAISIFGKDLGNWSPDRCVALGIGRKFQAANIFETLTVGECLRVSRYRSDSLPMWSASKVLVLPEAAMRIVSETGLVDNLNLEARHLSHGQKQALELAMGVSLEPRIVR